MRIEVSERDEFLLTMYHCDHMRFAAFCSEDDCNRVDILNESLTEKEISKCIENYNRREFGVTFAECEKRKCLLCKDANKCDLEKRKEYEKRVLEERK